MNPADLPDAVVRAMRCAVEGGELGADVAVPERVVVERTRPGGVGDYATPVAFQIGKAAGRAPRDVAAVLARRLAGEAGIEGVEVTGPGFVNFLLPPPSAPRLVAEVMGRDLPWRAASAASAISADVPTVDSGLRERVVRESVLRILRSQGGGDRRDVLERPPVAPVAPVAKRDGDVVRRFGPGAARWAMLCVPGRETPEFSGRLLVQGEENEFFRVRYAHARSRALLTNAARLGFGAERDGPDEPGDVDAPVLLRVLAEHRLVLEAAGHHRAPERLTRYLVELADALLDFQYRVLPHGDEKPSAAHRARLALAEAAGAVLAGGLALLGIDAPEHL
ncbi:ArgS-related anticodon-binding protein NrtL [Streptomyces sp. IBSNAI002]|uniref:ArgS-related anticodon-binding protein NrtL n=1 Tax=Streptomyces sp. IBSNAI002 TaxID=3457500 RepID=UPI003FD4D40A